MKSKRHRSPRPCGSKCVKRLDSPNIFRMPNDMAAAQIASGLAAYAPKSEWKKQCKEAAK